MKVSTAFLAFLELSRARILYESLPSTLNNVWFVGVYDSFLAYSRMNVIKSKLRTRLTEEHSNDFTSVNLSGYTPQYTPCSLSAVPVFSLSTDCTHLAHKSFFYVFIKNANCGHQQNNLIQIVCVEINVTEMATSSPYSFCKSDKDGDQEYLPITHDNVDQL